MERYLHHFGYLEQKTTCGMKDVQQVEVAPTASGDVPNNGGDILATLPEAPEDSVIEIENEKKS